MSKIGKLQEFVDTTVMIDGVYYDASKVVNYVPKQMNLDVEYSADDNNTLIFIKPAVSTSRQTTKRKPRGGTSDSRSNSICKQVIYKVAGFIVSRFSYSSLEEAIAAQNKVYESLKETHLQDLVE